MPTCAAPNCSQKWNPNVKFHSFPTDIVRRRQWADNTGRDFSRFANGLPPVSMKLCQAHFIEDQYRISNTRESLKKDAIPTLFDLNEQPRLKEWNNNEDLFIEDQEMLEVFQDDETQENNHLTFDEYQELNADPQVNEGPNVFLHCDNAFHNDLQILLEAAYDKIKGLEEKKNKNVQ